MIKILKEGRLMIKTCKDCGCKFQFDKYKDAEEKLKRDHNIFEVGFRECFIKCPQCQTEITWHC